MPEKNEREKAESMNILIDGRQVLLFFASEPNREAADYIKSILLNAYLLKAI